MSANQMKQHSKLKNKEKRNEDLQPLLLPLRHTQFMSAALVFLWKVSSYKSFNVLVAFERSGLIPVLIRSCRMVCIQVVFDLPYGLFTLLRYSSKVFFTGVFGCSRIICPNHISHISWFPGLHFVLVKNLLVVIFLCHLIPIILSYYLWWKDSMVFSRSTTNIAELLWIQELHIPAISYSILDPIYF